jgi:hypothetical protein
MTRIFMSCGRASLTQLEALARDLELAGLEVWFDRETSGGECWWSSILERIRESAVFLLLLTPDVPGSEACLRELDYALRLRRSILPLRVSGAVEIDPLVQALSGCPVLDYDLDDSHAPFGLIGAISRCAARAGPLPLPLPSPPAAPGTARDVLLVRADGLQPLVAATPEQPAEGAEREAGESPAADRLGGPSASCDPLPSGRRVRSPGREPGDDATPPPAAARVAVPEVAEIDAMLHHTAARLLGGGESWRIAADAHNFILLSSREERGRHTLYAKATVRDDTSDTKAKALQARGWTVSRYSTVKGLLAGGAIYATSGLAALALLSRKVRDQFMINEVSRIWTIADPAVELEQMVDDLRCALAIVAPQARKVTVRRMGGAQTLSELTV